MGRHWLAYALASGVESSLERTCMEVPALRTIIGADQISLVNAWSAMVCTLVVMIGWAAYAVGLIGFSPTESTELLLFSAAVPISLACLLWRVLKIRSAFTSGTQISGRISGFERVADTGYLRYEYDRGGLQSTMHLVHQNVASKGLREGQEVSIAISANGRVAFVAELFAPPGP